VAALWPPCGRPLAALWPPSGRLVTAFWPPSGRLLAASWPPSGRLVAALWPLTQPNDGPSTLLLDCVPVSNDGLWHGSNDGLTTVFDVAEREGGSPGAQPTGCRKWWWKSLLALRVSVITVVGPSDGCLRDNTQRNDGPTTVIAWGRPTVQRR